jgi:Icc protein
MPSVAWLTDIHLNFLPAAGTAAFLDCVADSGADSVMISGDIAESHDLVKYLDEFAARFKGPIYFVLGNHDYYFGSIREVRADVVDFCRRMPRLTWLSNANVVQLSPSVGLVGHDGWADGRLGDYERSMVVMNDYKLIAEFAGLNKSDRWRVLQTLGYEAAEHFRRVLPEALSEFPRVMLLTHVPPFYGACWYEGRISNDEWLPHFTCHAAGEAILEVMRDFPDRELTVLCGHTHGRGEYRPQDNVLVLTGAAEYGEPDIQRVFELD